MSPPPDPEPTADAEPRPPSGGWAWIARVATPLLALLHGAGIVVGMGGWGGLTGPWPPARHDHPLYFHSAWITRAFLARSGTTAGYDPYFMAGYAKSVVFPASSTLPEVVVALFGGSDPVRAYKLYVLASAAAVPWLIAAAGRAWRFGPGAVAWAVTLALVYLWTDFPIHYAAFGMLPYLVAVPLGLLATALIASYCERGGWARWGAAAAGSSAVVMVHLTSAMIVVPAAAAAYLASIRAGGTKGRRLPASRHVGVWSIPAVVLAANAFWWLPGVWLASTKGESGFAFAHSSEGVGARLLKIAWGEPTIQAVLWVVGVPGLIRVGRRDAVAAAGLIGFVAAGFGWGYLAGATPRLDFLQPGRHTYALYSGLCLAGGSALEGWLGKLHARSPRRAIGWGSVLILVGGLLFGLPLARSLLALLGAREPFLACEPPRRLLWVVDRVRRHVRPGERLLYEEGGFDLPGVPDPFRGGRFSGLLPYATGVEVLGGPYLHASLTTNFTQFGEGRLFGARPWGREAFVRYAAIYRPSAIVCWSPWARRFCRENPDLVEIRDDEGALLIGRVIGFGGATVRGGAEVVAGRGWLRVEGTSGDLDGTVVLRYHSVPCLRSRPPVGFVPIYLEDDPVPFIGLRAPPGDLTLELDCFP